MNIEEVWYQDVKELDSEVANALLHWGMSLADTKHRIGMRTSEWVNGTPALEAAVGASAITQDELGHARSYFSMLRDFPGAPDAIGFENDLEARDIYYYPRALNAPWDSWLNVIAVNVLLDRALSIAIESTSESAYAPLRQRTAKIMQEEEFHRIFGDHWLARLVGQRSETKRRLQASLERFWEPALGWIGPDDDPVCVRLNDAGILGSSPAQVRDRWLREVTVLLDKHDLAVPEAQPDWPKWNASYRDVY